MAIRNLCELASAEGLHNHGEISPRSWLAIVSCYVNFTTPHLHYAPTCEVAHCNSWTRCQKPVPGIHKNESPFRSPLKSSIMNRGRRLPAFTYFRTVFRNEEQFPAQAFFRLFFFRLLFIRNASTSPLYIRLDTLHSVIACERTSQSR